MYAVVLAGGQGTRLRPLVGDLPKPMAPVHGRPFLCYLLDLLERQGITDVVLSVGYRHEQITAFFGRQYRGLGLAYAIEAEPLGTGGGLQRALGLVERFPAFALNGDTYLELDYRAMLGAHQAAGTRLTIALRRAAEPGRYGGVEVQAAGRVVGFRATGAGAGLINAGVYLVADNLLVGSGLEPPFSFEQDFLEPRIAELRPLAFETQGYFIDIGVPEDYARAQHELSGR